MTILKILNPEQGHSVEIYRGREDEVVFEFQENEKEPMLVLLNDDELDEVIRFLTQI